MRSSEPKTASEWLDLTKLDGEKGREDFQWGWQWFAGSTFLNCSILDVGAGLGGSKSRLNHTGMNDVTTQDVLPLKGIADHLPGIDLVRPIEDIPDKSYDVVTSFDVIEHVIEDIDFMQHLTRIARKAVFITTPNYNNNKCSHPYHVREYTPAQLARMAKGFQWKGFAGDPNGDPKIGEPIRELNTVTFLQHNLKHHALWLDVENVRPEPVPNSLSIIVPTARPHFLARTLVSIMQQAWRSGDEIVVINDGANAETDRVIAPFLQQFPDRFRVFHTPQPTNDYGHTPRNLIMHHCHGEYCIHMDDDDVYVPDAFQVVRRRIETTRKPMYMFRMRFWDTGYTLWGTPSVQYGNVSTQQIVHKLEYGTYGHWEPKAGGDLGFIWSTAELNNNDVEWDETVITVCRPEYDLIEGVKWQGEKKVWSKSVND